MSKSNIYYFALLLCVFIGAVQSLDCLDASMSPVAWWAKLKLPQAVKRSAHLYYDSASDAAGEISFRGQNINIDDEGSALFNTLDQLNHMSRSNINILAFNDEFPNGATHSNRAHAKGVIAFDTSSKTGFYLMHSTPKFPAIDDSIVNPKLPPTGLLYGQNYMCITIDTQGLSSIIASLKVSHPNIYYDNGHMQPTDSKDRTHSETIGIRLNHQKITFISKSPQHHEYFYSAVVSPFFQTGLAVESWSHPDEPSQCSDQYESVNIRHVQFDNQIHWTIFQDHSKWAISLEGNQNVACFGDINRAASQKKRGGGALCFDRSSNLHHALKALITNYDECHASFLSLYNY